jgi:hypothetical protein
MTMLFRQMATIPGIRGETGIEVVEAEAEEGSREAEGRVLVQMTRGNVTASAILVEANTSRQFGSSISCVTN